MPQIQFQLDQIQSQSFQQQSSGIQPLPEIDSVSFAPVEDIPEDDQVWPTLTVESSEPKASAVSPQLNDAAKIKHIDPRCMSKEKAEQKSAKRNGKYPQGIGDVNTVFQVKFSHHDCYQK